MSNQSVQSKLILHVLRLRQAEVRNVLAASQGQDAEAVILDRATCVHVEKVLYWEYLAEPDIQALKKEVWERAHRLADERRTSGQRPSPKDLFERSMKSYWKTTVFNRYGGEIWLLTLIATGRMHPISVKIVNDIFAQRIRDQAGREPVSDPRRPSHRHKPMPRRKAKSESCSTRRFAPAGSGTRPGLLTNSGRGTMMLGGMRPGRRNRGNRQDASAIATRSGSAGNPPSCRGQ